jgi:hypothetical protein
MDRTYVTESEEARGRLEGLVARLADTDMSRPLGPDWTVSSALMHLAFWDRQWLLKLEEWEQTGQVHLPPVADITDGANRGMLPWWRTFTPAKVRQEVLAAAEAMDRKAAMIPEPLAEVILATRPRTLNRSVHRREHSEEIEQVLSELQTH